MRKGISILFALIMILSGAQFTIATHYCGGKIAATKVSLSGKLASCEMEDNHGNCTLPGNHFSNHCCDNQVTIIGIVNNFKDPVSIQHEVRRNIAQYLYIPVNQSLYSIPVFNHLYTNTGPPGWFTPSSVNLDNICTFRI